MSVIDRIFHAIGALVDRVQSIEPTGDLIPVRPKNYRRIALYAISLSADPRVLMNRKRIFDFSERGPLTQKGIRACIDFEIRDGATPILGFHDHPDEMWVAEKFSDIADHCAAQGWMRIRPPAA